MAIFGKRERSLETLLPGHKEGKEKNQGFFFFLRFFIHFLSAKLGEVSEVSRLSFLLFLIWSQPGEHNWLKDFSLLGALLKILFKRSTHAHARTHYGRSSGRKSNCGAVLIILKWLQSSKHLNCHFLFHGPFAGVLIIVHFLN